MTAMPQLPASRGAAIGFGNTSLWVSNISALICDRIGQTAYRTHYQVTPAQHLFL